MPQQPKDVIWNMISVALELWSFLKHVSVLNPRHISHELEENVVF